MRRYLLFLLALPLCAAPTVTVSATAQTLLGTNQTISLQVDLVDPNNTGLLRVNGTQIIPIMTASTVTPGATATVGPIYGNDVIRDGFGNLNGTYYRVRVFTVINSIISSTAAFQQFFAFTGAGTVDLATATPLAPSFMTGTSGSVVIPGALTTNGTATFTGLLNCRNLENVQCVDNNLGRGGSDIGAEINLAYAALTGGTTVGQIFVAPKSDGTCYSYSTPILMNTAGKVAMLSGWLGTVCLNYTPTTATTAITCDYYPVSSNAHFNGHCVSNVRLINNGDAAPNGGGGTSATGLLLGTTNGAEGATLLNFTVASFATGISIPGGGVNSFGMVCVNCVVARNITGVSVGAVTESVSFHSGRIIVNGTGISYGQGDVFLYGMSIDSNTTVAATGSGNLHGNGNHWENFNTSNCNYINSTNGNVSLNGDAMADDSVGGTCNWFVHLSGGTGSFNGVVVSSPNQTVTQAILVDQPSTAYINLINGSAANITVVGGSAANQSIVDTSQGKSSDPIHSSLFGQGITIPATANNVSTSSRSVTFQNLNSVGVVENSTLGVGVNTANRAYLLPDAGGNIPVSTCTTSQKTESAADTNVLTCAIPATAASYRIRFILSIFSANTATLGWTATWTNSNGVAETPTNLPILSVGQAATVLTFTTSSGGDAYGYADADVNNAGTSIVVKLTFTGTSFSGKVSATVERII